MEYICKRCGYKSEYLYSYNRHINRKNMCKPVILDIIPEKIVNLTNNTCIICKKIFTNNFKKHEDNCKFKYRLSGGKPLTNKEIKAKFIELETKIDTVIVNQNNIIDNLKSELQNTTINNTINIENVNIKIVLNDIREPSIDHIPIELIETLLMSFKLKNPLLFEKIYFDKEAPQNHGIYMKNKRSKQVSVFLDNAFKTISVEEMHNKIDVGIQIAQNNLIQKLEDSCPDVDTIKIDNELDKEYIYKKSNVLLENKDKNYNKNIVVKNKCTAKQTIINSI